MTPAIITSHPTRTSRPRMSARRAWVVAAACLLAPACRKSPEAHGHAAVVPPGTTVARIRVFRSGRVEFNDRPVTPQEFVAAIRQLPPGHSMVWYYREAAEQPPTPQALAIFQAMLCPGG